MDEMESKFSYQVPGADLGKFNRAYYYQNDHTVRGFYEAADAHRGGKSGRRWISDGPFPDADDAPCYYYYFLWFDLTTRKLEIECGNDGVRDHGRAPPGLG